MSQFDVHKNPGRNPAFPFVVVVQSAAFDRLNRRLVVPLLDAGIAGKAVVIPYSDVTPVFTVQGKKLVLNPFEMVSVPAKQLGTAVASLASEGEAIIKALDEVFSRAYG